MKSKEQNIDYTLFLIISGLILLGSVMVYSSSSAIAQDAVNQLGKKFSSHAFFLKRQVVWLVLAYVAMFTAMRINIEKVRRFIPIGLGISFVLLMVVFITPSIRGTHRWLSLGIVTLQPSEIFKYMLIFYLAHSLSQKGRTLDNLKLYRWPYGPIILSGIALIILEPDLGSVLVLGTTVIILLYLAGARLSHIAYSIGGSAVAVYLLVFVGGYNKSRVLAFFTWLTDPMQAPHQVKQSILSMANGGIMGTGLGDGILKQFFLPEPHTDFIFASIGEELGLWGLLLILGLFFGAIWRGMRIAIEQKDKFRFLLASGLILCLAVNACINIAVVLGLIPTTGLTLPFLSYGGSSLIVSAASVGLLLNLSRQRVRMTR
ncbi:MAG: putative lipid II flippase FtsW [candidate division Zixibacteria bacterium]|nr:putative lipid II flippase FtsW [candidate division Zixibacteria bacterium]